MNDVRAPAADPRAPRAGRRPVDPEIDEIAVERCARGTLHHSHLTWLEFEEVLRRLDVPTVPDRKADEIIGAPYGYVGVARRRRGVPRTTVPEVTVRSRPDVGRRQVS